MHPTWLDENSRIIRVSEIRQSKVDSQTKLVSGFVFDLTGSALSIGAATLAVGIQLADGSMPVGAGGDFEVKSEDERRREESEVRDNYPRAQMSQIVALSGDRFVANEWAQDKTRGKVKRHIWSVADTSAITDQFIWEDSEFDRIKAIRDMIGSIMIGFCFALVCQLIIDKSKLE